MGFNTTVFVLNDQLDIIRNDPEQFVTDIVHGLSNGNDFALGQSTVMRSEHADIPRLYFTQFNTITDLSGYNVTHEKIGEAAVRKRIAAARSMLDHLEHRLDSETDLIRKQ